VARARGDPATGHIAGLFISGLLSESQRHAQIACLDVYFSAGEVFRNMPLQDVRGITAGVAKDRRSWCRPRLRGNDCALRKSAIYERAVGLSRRLAQRRDSVVDSTS
jgi:hypothetical protein